MSQEAKDQNPNPFSPSKLSLYCHVPFCAHRCSFCAFYQESPTKQYIEKYLTGIEKEFSILNISIPFDTIYVGGGTPGLLSTEHLDRLCKILTKNNFPSKISEFSMEFSPASVKFDKIQVLKHYGCNRITLGIQSFNSKTIQALGRRQTINQVHRAYDIIKSSGIQNIGIDLIFGIPSQSVEEWISDLKIAIGLDANHISTYNLTFEENSDLYARLKKNLIPQKSEEEDVKFYLNTWKFLKAHGYQQYEISNFCRPGYESKHNCNTWAMEDWIGIGPSACSQYNMKRFSNPPNIDQWLNSLTQDRLPRCNIANLTDSIIIQDSIIFGLRMNRGVNMKNLKSRFPNFDFSEIERTVFKLLESKLLSIRSDYISLTTKGRLLADHMATKFL